jgi:phenylacetic acid degradation protein
MPKVYAIDGIVPVVHPSAFVHDSAVLIGDVIVGARAYIGPCASLRGDFGRIVVEEGANVQDSCILHGFPGKDTVLGRGASLGHGAVLHGCVIGAGALVGMNAVVNDNAEVGEQAMIAALAFVRAEAKIPARSLAAGIPAKVMRELSADELRWKRDNAAVYQRLAQRSAQTMQRVEALAQPEPGRRRFEMADCIPLSEMKAKRT